MPTYQYACTKCDHRMEAVQSFTDAALTECPECGGRLRKLYGGVGIVFKGSGFYRNDSRSGAAKSSSGSDSSSSTSTTPAKSSESNGAKSSSSTTTPTKTGSSSS